MRQFDGSKFRELVLYIAEQSEGDPRFGAVKLNKILYYSDFEAFRVLGESITGATYRKLSEGPAPLQMLEQRKVLLDSGATVLENRPYFTGTQHRIVAKREPRKDLFQLNELKIVDQVIQGLWHMTACDASEFSHRELGWQAADLGEEIPYQTAWLSPGPVPQEAEEYAAELAERLSTG